MKNAAAILICLIMLASCIPKPVNIDPENTTDTQSPTAAPAKEKIMYELDENIAVNQIGYFSSGKKVFWMPGVAGSFDIVREDTGDIIYSASMHEQGMDTAIGSIASFGDFSEVTQPGRYFIAVDGNKSYSFDIAENPLEKLSTALLKMLYYQRCGVALEAQYTGEDYVHAACHTEPGGIWDKEGSIDGTGGWHDAGDYGRYSVPCVRTVADLLFSYELYPEVFGDDTGIPESGNGVPDVLDEAKVGLSWLIKMQREDGGVYHKYTKANFCGMVMPEADILKSYAMPVSPTATAGFCAIMAKAARVYREIDKDFAQTCSDAALKAWHFMERNTDMPMFENPDGVTTGDYKDTSDRDERYWAAVEMYLLKGEQQYIEEAKSLYTQHTALYWSDTLEWYDVGFLGTFSYLLSDKADKDSEFYAKIKADTINTADKLIELARSKAYGIAMDDKDYIWGSDMVLTNRADVLLVAYEINPKPEYLTTAQAHINYLLGQNALSQCYVTGFGEKTIMYPHHRPSVADKVRDPIPGMVSGGPNSSMQDTVARMYFDGDTPPALCFADETAAYSLNEVTTYWNSSALFLASGLISHK